MDEVLSWPDDGNRYELVDGILLVTPAPVPIHQVVAQRLAIVLSDRVRPWPDVYATPGEILIRPGIKLEPDVLVFRTVSLQRKWEEIREHWLAVEVFSPSSRIYDREVKRDAYLQIGVAEVWLVDVEGKKVFVSRQGGAIDVPHERELPWRPSGVPAPDHPPPIDLTEIFAGLD